MRIVIICGKCSKPIEKGESYDDPASGDHVWRVQCHGEEAEVRINRHEVLEPDWSVMRRTVFQADPVR